MIQQISGIDSVQVYENNYKTQSNRKMIVYEKPNDEVIIESIKADL